MAVPSLDSHRPPLTEALLRRAQERLAARRQALLGQGPSAHAHALDRGELDRIETALSWFDARVYGSCSVCASPLSAQQIERDPADLVCPKCTAIHRRLHPRPDRATMLSLDDDLETLDQAFWRARGVNGSAS